MRQNKKFASFSELAQGERVIDILSGMVYELEVRGDVSYLSTDESLFPVSHFKISNLERYDGEKEPGEKEYGYF